MGRWRRIFLVLLFAAAVSPTRAQTPVPLGDPVEIPQLPPSVTTSPVQLQGAFLYLWTESDNSRVIHFVGDFTLQVGGRIASAREAIIWMTPQQVEAVSYQHLEMFLWDDARVSEASGTVTEGPVLFVTLDAAGEITLRADQTAHHSSADQPGYSAAFAVRNQFRSGQMVGSTGELQPAGATVQRVEKPRSPVQISWEGNAEGGEVFTIQGNVRVLQSDPVGADSVEMRADSAVIFLGRSEEPKVREAGQPSDLTTPRLDASSLLGEGRLMSLDVGAQTTSIEGIYLEGDVRLARGGENIRASRLYYDFEQSTAIILDAVVTSAITERQVPVFIRAQELRQISSTSYSANQAMLTTSEFHTPHYHIGAEQVRVDFKGSSSAAVGGREYQSGLFTLTHGTLNVGGVPFLYWPYIAGEFSTGETTLRGVRTGYSDRFGVEVETQWRLFNLLGLPTPPGYDATLRLDEFTDRGPAVGIDFDYEREDYFGLVRTYFISDKGIDDLPWYLDDDPDSSSRGRALWRHRHYLEDDWQLTLEGSYISDRGFLEEYYEREFEVGKDQETNFYLKKQRDNWAFTALAQWRINDFFTQTESLPDFSFRLVGQPLGGGLTWYSENRLGLVRYRPAEQEVLEILRFGLNEAPSETVLRADSRQEVEYPLDLGPIRVVPFGAIRGSGWEDSPMSSAVGRYFGTYGLRGSGYLSRVFPDHESELFDIHGLRHIIKPDFTVWGSHTNTDSNELYPFDENVEVIDEIDGATVGVRQRWQTKRGEGEQRRSVDVLTLDVEYGAFSDVPGDEFTAGYTSFSRPENSISSNFVNESMIWRINDATALIHEASYDTDEGDLDVANVSYVVERDPRLSYLLGYRYIGEIESNLLGVGVNYKLTEKHTVAFREEFDLERGSNHEFTLAYIRKMPRWYMGFDLDIDTAEDDFGLSVTIWPEGLPNLAVGPRRFTGLADSIGIRPE